MIVDPSYLQRVDTRIRELEEQMADASAEGHTGRFKQVIAEHAHQKRIRERTAAYLDLMKELEGARTMAEDADSDPDMREMAREELETLEARRPGVEKRLMVALLPPDPVEERNIIMEIRAGTGGEEAALFAGDLFRMYHRYADSQGWKIDLIDAGTSQTGGYKEVIFTVEGEGLYRRMRYESGVHRVQRVPATEGSGRIHTSAATVAVLPEAEEMDDQLEIPNEDIRIDVFRSSGPGGQSVNTTDSAVRITHIPTGLVVQCQDEKSQHRNRDKALRVLKARLLDRKRAEEASKTADARKSQIGSGDRSERIRTYNFPQNRVTDHRIGLTLHNLDRIMEGDLDELLQTLYDQDVETRLAAQQNT